MVVAVRFVFLQFILGDSELYPPGWSLLLFSSSSPVPPAIVSRAPGSAFSVPVGLCHQIWLLYTVARSRDFARLALWPPRPLTLVYFEAGNMLELQDSIYYVTHMVPHPKSARHHVA